jgi:hypothetical protein
LPIIRPDRPIHCENSTLINTTPFHPHLIATKSL